MNDTNAQEGHFDYPPEVKAMMIEIAKEGLKALQTDPEITYNDLMNHKVHSQRFKDWLALQTESKDPLYIHALKELRTKVNLHQLLNGHNPNQKSKKHG